ncbi:MAG: NnrS family protein [Deltaproteobacteria bacterium]
MKRITGKNDQIFSLFESAYRPFFILATISSLFFMTIWTAFYTFRLNLNFENISPAMWHAHEMLFGYTMTVIAGFILTVEKYWLGVVINKKSVLISLVVLWILARVSISLTFIAGFPWKIGAVVDCLFLIILTIRVAYPIIGAKAWSKTVPSAHLAIITAGNIIFYLGLFGILSNGQYLGVYSALFAIISFILIMGRRMIPIFIRNGLKFKFDPRNWRAIDMLGIVFFVLFFVTELFSPNGKIASVISGILVVIFSIRLYGWYSGKIWSKPMLWVLFVAYTWIVIGFGLKFLSLYFNIPGFLSVHSFTYGGIGVMTIGFMARVTLGHTGRDVFDPPKIVFWIFAALLAGAIVRVFFPLIDRGHYLIWIGVSQLLWILSFLIFAIVFFPMLFTPALEKKA